MPYEFSPEDRLQNIMWVIDQLQNRYHDSNDDQQRNFFMTNQQVVMGKLIDAIEDMRPTVSPPSSP